jgi:ammonium transporter, Amt family
MTFFSAPRSRIQCKHQKPNPWKYGGFLFFPCAVLIFATQAFAADSVDLLSLAQLKQQLQIALDTLWVILASGLVFFMNAGFAMLEAGFCRVKNTVNLLAKNLIVFAIATLAFWIVGFGFMFGFGGDWSTPSASDNGFIGLHGFWLQGADNSPAVGADYRGVFRALNGVGIPLQAKFFFHLVFAGTAATIVSGAVAERIKFFAFVLFSVSIAGLIYPIVGHWVWGGGWLNNIGFWDFAGSTVVHSVGGWAALVGTVLLGPRMGKYKGTESFALPGHNFAVATLGCFILWLGWFGFNPGSTLSADPSAIAHILLTTNMAAATGGITAMILSWRYFGKPDLSLMINGILVGLVSITAACRYVNLGAAALIGIAAGCMMVYATDAFDRFKIDDPVGAISVHLVGGIWGTLAVGLFAVGANTPSAFRFVPYSSGPKTGLFFALNVSGLQPLSIQILGIAAVAIFSVLMSWGSWFLIKMVMGLRVTPEEELKGLDLSQHGMLAYTGFKLKNEP